MPPFRPPSAGDPSPVERAVTRAPYFTVRERRLGPDLLLITAAGDVDVLTVATLAAALEVELPAMTVLDLSLVTLMSAAGLRVLMAAATRAGPEHRQLRLVTANRSLTTLLRVTDIDQYVPVYPTLSAALHGTEHL